MTLTCDSLQVILKSIQISELQQFKFKGPIFQNKPRFLETYRSQILLMLWDESCVNLPIFEVLKNAEYIGQG